jgi:MoxR-like ATPase
MLLAALSGEHILFIGPPGTAKSELGRRLSRLYNGPFFERLLTRFSVPEVGLARGLLIVMCPSLSDFSLGHRGPE